MGNPKLSKNARKLAREQQDLVFEIFLEFPPVGVCDGVVQLHCRDSRMRQERAGLESAARTDATIQTYHSH